jgi:hypothetical protein
MTQNQRVLDYLERHGYVNTVDFMAPEVCDGGRPIIRLAARIYDLRVQGHHIDDLKEANGTVTYLWRGVEREADGPREPASVPLDTPLFDQPATVGNAIGGWD